MQQRPLIAAQESEADQQDFCGRTWISWRGNSENRTPWKAVCSVLLLGQMAAYFYLVASSVALCFMGIVFLAKLLIEIWGQHTPTWACPGTWCLFFVIWFMGFPWLLSTFAYCTKTTDIQFPHRDIVATGLYVFGSMFSLSYEVHRFYWKAKDENKGKLFTSGLASLCIHPNYFGDLFTYTGWALAAGTVYALQVSLMQVWMFSFWVIANSDTYLAKRYPEEFPAYAASTATLIPFFRSQIALQILGWICLAISVYCSSTYAAACGL